MITGEDARHHVQKQRHRYSAIMVGIGTVLPYKAVVVHNDSKALMLHTSLRQWLIHYKIIGHDAQDNIILWIK